MRAWGEWCKRRLIAEPFPKALSRSVSWRVSFQRQFVCFWALWQRVALWWRKPLFLRVCARVCMTNFWWPVYERFALTVLPGMYTTVVTHMQPFFHSPSVDSFSGITSSTKRSLDCTTRIYRPTCDADSAVTACAPTPLLTSVFPQFVQKLGKKAFFPSSAPSTWNTLQPDLKRLDPAQDKLNKLILGAIAIKVLET